MKTLLIGCLLFALSASAHATFIPGDGTDLRDYFAKYEASTNSSFNYSNATDAFHVGVLVGYVEGIILSLEAQKIICLPNMGFSSANYLDIVGRYLNKTPRKEKEVGAVLITAAFQEDFTCKQWNKQ